ncbi:HigA family addiction module antitoxin [Serratia sp. BIGb0163]|uniref:HigA family addiction module antitoxin n=1 Tax=Serratia sp. BIGb0163 TaxID=2940613 RepID=UPI002169BD42|nr:HigA family addiction module antitoxin [Serratia sp. BIGb0163]MCS4266585.1 addiction module HigA family antidote [Serratia sp. BIGb0163]
MHMFNPPHPREVLRDYLDGVSVTDAAAALKITCTQLSRILNNHAAITADMVLRLSSLLGTSAEMWVDMQSEYELWQAPQKSLPIIEPLHRQPVLA